MRPTQVTGLCPQMMGTGCYEGSGGGIRAGGPHDGHTHPVLRQAGLCHRGECASPWPCYGAVPGMFRPSPLVAAMNAEGIADVAVFIIVVGLAGLQCFGDWLSTRMTFREWRRRRGYGA